MKFPYRKGLRGKAFDKFKQFIRCFLLYIRGGECVTDTERFEKLREIHLDIAEAIDDMLKMIKEEEEGKEISKSEFESLMGRYLMLIIQASGIGQDMQGGEVK